MSAIALKPMQEVMTASFLSRSRSRYKGKELQALRYTFYVLNPWHGGSNKPFYGVSTIPTFSSFIPGLFISYTFLAVTFQIVDQLRGRHAKYSNREVGLGAGEVMDRWSLRSKRKS